MRGLTFGLKKMENLVLKRLLILKNNDFMILKNKNTSNNSDRRSIISESNK
jgi:hypothetical protein